MKDFTDIMTVVVSCNLPEGVIFGVDSAETVPDKLGGSKTYENATKLFRLGELPIGIAVYGISTLGNRSIGSYIKQFKIEKRDQIENMASMESLVEALRIFFSDVYSAKVVPSLENEFNAKLNQIDKNDIPVVGLVIGGFPKESYLSEVWEIQIPFMSKPDRKRGPEEFGTNAFALSKPIMRFIQGYDYRMIDDLLEYFEIIRQKPLSGEELKEITKIVKNYSMVVPFNGMSIQDGVDYTRFLINLAINHYRYAAGIPCVGGRAKIGVVTYSDQTFKILE
jgi:hypothetical protein